MKKIYYFISICAILISMSSCSVVSVNGGEEAVFVEKPYIFGHGGVDLAPLTQGSAWCAVSTDVVKFNTTPVTYSEDFKNLVTQDHNTITFAAHLRIKIQDGKTPKLYTEFKEHWYENNLQQVFRTEVRDKISDVLMFDVVSNRKISDSISREILKDMQVYAKSKGIPVDVTDLQIGNAVPSDEVLRETQFTAAQNQNKLTQDARGKSEIARKDADIKKADADKAYMNEMGMTIEQYQHQRQLEIDKEKVELIKDNKNVTIIFTSNGTQLPTTYPVK